MTNKSALPKIFESQHLIRRNAMTSLSISNHKPQSSASAASALPGSTPADSLATDTQSADPFAFLLAQQISATD
jgi:hypothetical protein